MTIKNFFRSLYYAQISIEKKKEKIEELQTLAETTGAIRYDKVHVVTSNTNEGGFENRAVKIADLQQKLREDIDDLTEMMDRGRRYINSLEDQSERTVMELRYFNHMTFRQIAQKMKYSEDTIYYKHRSAIKNIIRAEK